MITLEEEKLQKEVRKLKGHLKACLELIEELSNLDAPLLEADLPLSFKKRYILVVSRARKALE